MCLMMKLNKNKTTCENNLVFLLTIHHSELLGSYIEYIYIYL